MINFTRFKAILIARNNEFWRDRASMSWNIAFPVLLIFGLSIIFSGDGRNQLKMGLLNETDIPAALNIIQYTDFVFYKDSAVAQLKVAQHQIDLLIDWKKKEYWLNDSSPKGYLAEKVFLSSKSDFIRRPVDGEPIRYVDWVIPGILGMNIMFSCLFGVGYVIVRYRKNGVLKRLKATPVSALEFILAQIMSRFFIVVILSSFIFVSTWAIIDFKVLGSFLTLLLILCVGTFSLIALGLMIASRSNSEELTGGLLNFASWPMMFLSGVWFSLEGAPEIIQQLAQFFPLTHFVSAARAVMTEGATIADIQFQLLAMGFMAVLFFTMSALMFSWGKNR